jgi:multidrug efflux pump subunit AcrA (membrane-fusion protein)
MRAIVVGIAGVLSAAGTVALGQDYWWGGPYYDYRAATPAESAARGMADVARAQGQYNLATSAAAINMTEAQRNYMRNRDEWTNTYFQMREANRQYRAAKNRKPTMEQLVRFAQAGKPDRLSPSELDVVSGDISWPGPLETDAFSEHRKTLEALFAKRAESGTLGFDDQDQLRQVTSAILARLKQQLRDGKIRQMDYIGSKRFVESIAYEGRRPVT